MQTARSKIFITGSADGLGQMAAQLLVKDGHHVVLHARSEARGREAMAAVPGAAGVITGDLSSITQTKAVAEQANKLGAFDAVIHNAAVGYREGRRVETEDGLPHVFAINTLAPYILTCLMHRPGRLVYLSSSLHRSGDALLKDILWNDRPWSGIQAYADTKLHDAILAMAIARRWLDVLSNAVEPGWVATKMGGAGALDSLEEGPKTQAWLAVSSDKAAQVSGQYFYHQRQKDCLPAVRDKDVQERLLAECERLSGIALLDKHKMT